MTWSYNPTLVTTKDQVRFLSNDNVVTRQFLQDEEIAWIITQFQVDGVDKPWTSAAVAVDRIRGRITQQASKVTTGDVSKQYGNQDKAFAMLSDELWTQARAIEGSNKATVLPYLAVLSGGADDCPYFRSGQFDNPRAGGDGDPLGLLGEVL